jgi:hypothetical protein
VAACAGDSSREPHPSSYVTGSGTPKMLWAEMTDDCGLSLANNGVTTRAIAFFFDWIFPALY